MGKCFIDYCKTVDSNTIDGYVDQLKIFYQHFDQLDDAEKGNLIGYTIGKYGVDIFAGGFGVGSALKGGKLLLNGALAYRNLKNVNRACNLEAIAISNVNKETIVTESLKHAAARESYFNNVKYNFDSHNKHVPGQNDFVTTGSVWEHKDPESLLKRFAGKGVSGGNKQPGTCGYKETVDFGEHIGIWKSVDGKIQISTTRGTIHYAKKGAHIALSNPNPIIKN